MKATIGAHPAFTIKQARDRHAELPALVQRGQSPAKAKRALSTEQKLADARRLSLPHLRPALGQRSANPSFSFAMQGGGQDDWHPKLTLGLLWRLS